MINEKRLIDVNAALERVCENCCCDFEECKRIGFCVLYTNIEQLPTVDAVEVVHGRWIEDYETFVQDNGYESEPIHTGFLCSVCGRHSCSIEPYCHCGAKMDG